MFKKLEVDNFKSLVDFAIDFEPMSVIIGNNATGKSTILQVIDFLCSTVREDFEIILERRGLQVDNIKSKITGSNKIHFKSTIVLTEGQEEVEYVWDMVLNAVASKNTVQLQSQCNSNDSIKDDRMLDIGG